MTFQQQKINTKSEALTSAEQAIAQAVYVQCFGIKPGEKVAIVYDLGKQEEAELLATTAALFDRNVTGFLLEGMTENAQEPPEEFAKILGSFDIALFVTTFSLSHTRAREKACEQGTRIASLPGITLEMLSRTMAADYGEIAVLSDALANQLTKAKMITITSPAGTKLTAQLGERLGLSDSGDLTKSGAFGNLPAGEAFIAPLEESVQGTLVIDGSLADIVLDEPITITIVDGRAKNVAGGQAAQELLAAMDVAGPNACIVGEIGIGTNPLALFNSDILEAEKTLGTCHVAFGDNMSFGGKNEAPFHTDGLVMKPTVLLDSEVLMVDGVLQK